MEKKSISEYLTVLGSEIENIRYLTEAEVTGLSYDSRRAESGHIFFCKGEAFKREYAEQARIKGCVCLVYSAECASAAEAALGCDICMIRVKQINRAMALCAAHYYGYPMQRLTSIAVTGTKGKTTVSRYISSALSETVGFKSAVLSDLVQKDAPRLTTPEAIELHRAAAKAVSLGCTHIVCEISSQAQKMGRTYGILFDYGCFTNYGCDHISPKEHKDEAEYFECKASLFEQCVKKIFNTDDEKGRRLYEKYGSDGGALSFSVTDNNADYFGKDIRTEDHGCDLSVICKGKGSVLQVLASGVGAFGAENALCAAAVATECGSNGEAVFRGIATARAKGRGEIFESADGKITVVVDYAHNEMSFNAMLESAKTAFTGAFVTVIFGCPGEKAYCRRDQLARVCVKYADKVTVCEDDSGNEGYEHIKKELRECFQRAFDGNGKCRLSPIALSFIENRSTALERAVAVARDDGGKHVIFLLGKGDEELNRACGCDEKCVSDLQLAENAVKKYDLGVQLKKMLEGSKELNGRRLLICIEQGAEIVENAAPSIADIRKKGAAVYAVCNGKSFTSIEKILFCQGIGVAELYDGRESEARTSMLARSAERIGLIPIFVAENIKKCAIKVAERMKFDDIVYLESNSGIISDRKLAVRRLSLRRARIIEKYMPDPKLRYAISAFSGGAERVAVLDGRAENAIAAFICGGGFEGTVIKRRDA